MVLEHREYCILPHQKLGVKDYLLCEVTAQRGQSNFKVKFEFNYDLSIELFSRFMSLVVH